jgi:hypothetical protein
VVETNHRPKLSPGCRHQTAASLVPPARPAALPGQQEKPDLAAEIALEASSYRHIRFDTLSSGQAQRHRINDQVEPLTGEPRFGIVCAEMP